jgi:hypothetical protein
VQRASGAHFEKVIVVAGYVVAFRNFRHRPDGGEKARTMLRPLEPNGHKRRERIAGGGGIDQGGISPDHTPLLEAPHTIGRGRGRETEVLRQFGPGRPASLHE